MKDLDELLRGIGRVIARATPGCLDEARQNNSEIQILDVREVEETRLGTLVGARCIPRGRLEVEAVTTLDATKPTYVYCASGPRSLLACRSLVELGFSDVWSLDGGYQEWVRLGFEIDSSSQLGPRQRERFSAHLALPEIGEAGQLKLAASKVLCVGAGALGSSSILYLAAAGVGTLGIIDDDRVEISNLARQTLHAFDRVGELKVESARQAIARFSPDTRVVPTALRVDACNAGALIAGYDLVVDGTDNVAARAALNTAALALSVPVVHASVHRFEGRVSLFDSRGGPCYRCLVPETSASSERPEEDACSVQGVLGVVPGIMGMLQALEAIKCILGVGESLACRVLIFDALDAEFRCFKLRARQDCPYCGPGSRTERASAGEPGDFRGLG